jgi:hypothetical protein
LSLKGSAIKKHTKRKILGYGRNALRPGEAVRYLPVSP